MSDYRELLDHLENHIVNLQDRLSHTVQELEGLYHIIEVTPNDKALGSKAREYYFNNTEPVEEEPVYIYESPDGGETLYKRRIGAYADKRKVTKKGGEQLELDLKD